MQSLICFCLIPIYAHRCAAIKLGQKCCGTRLPDRVCLGGEVNYPMGCWLGLTKSSLQKLVSGSCH